MIAHIQSSVVCPWDFRIMPGGGKNYDHGMRVDQEVFLAYFSPAGVRCDTCNRPVNLWDCVGASQEVRSSAANAT